MDVYCYSDGKDRALKFIDEYKNTYPSLVTCLADDLEVVCTPINN